VLPSDANVTDIGFSRVAGAVIAVIGQQASEKKARLRQIVPIDQRLA
jgi:ABC-type protease/lipase transport system fused ATPase/permease subunit